MKRREEKRREFHEALLRTLYPPPSSPSPPPSPPPPVVDEDPFDVTLIDPEDDAKIGSSDNEDDYKNGEGDELETGLKPSRAQRKRLRKKMLKEEAVRRRELIGPLLPSTMVESRGPGADAHIDSEFGCSGGDGRGEQSVRGNVQEKEEESSGRDKMGKVKKRREAKKLARESSKPCRFEDHPIPETQN